MNRLRLAFRPYEVRFGRPLVTARMTYAHRRGWWVAVRDDQGVGYGEVAPLPSFGTEAEEEASRALLRVRATGLPLPEGNDVAAIEAVLGALDLAGTPAVRAGLELALLDRGARLTDTSVAALFTARPVVGIPVQRLLPGIDWANEAQAALAQGFTTLKLKVGTGPLVEEVTRVAALRALVGPEVRLRLDANGAWDPAEARAAIEGFAPSDIDLLEQPVDSGDPAILGALRGKGVPIGADEALVDPVAARRLVAERAVDALVLKPTILGGLSVAHGLAREAERAGIRVIMTSALERSLGVAGALHLACALGTPEPCGLGTLSLLESRDVERGPVVERGHMALRGPGLGWQPPEDELPSLDEEVLC